MAKDWTEENLDAQIQTELTAAEYWEIQADTWRNKYLDAANEIERLREALREISKLTWYDEMLGPKIARAALKEKE